MNIIYRPGSSNQNADGLSRQAWSDEVAGEQDGIKDVPVRVGEPRSRLSRGGCGNAHSGSCPEHENQLPDTHSQQYRANLFTTFIHMSPLHGGWLYIPQASTSGV